MLPYANLLANLRTTCKTAVLKNSFSNSFFGFPQKTKKKKRNSKNKYFSVEICSRISRSIANPKSGF